MRRRAVLTTAILAAVATPGTARAADPGPSVTKKSTTQLDAQAVYFVSYDGLVNNNSFQKNGLLTYKGYQYAAWYTATKRAVVARRVLGATSWSTITLSHTLKSDDSHNVISMGVSRTDGRLHLHMDSHSDGFFYVKSVSRPPRQPGVHRLDFGRPRRRTDIAGRRRTHQPVHLPPVHRHPRGRTAAQLPRRDLRQRPQRPCRVRRFDLDGAGGVERFDRHLHQHARLQHRPQHVPARHRLRRQRYGCTPSSPGASSPPP